MATKTAKPATAAREYYSWFVFDRGEKYEAASFSFAGTEAKTFLKEGRRIDSWTGTNTVLLQPYSAGPDNHHLWCRPDVRILSNPLKELLEKEVEKEDVQFLPVTIQPHPDGTKLENYWVMNITRWIDCVDWSVTASERGVDGKKKVNVSVQREPILDYQKIPDDSKLFRVVGAGGIVVRGDLVTKIKKAKFDTLDLSKASISNLDTE